MAEWLGVWDVEQDEEVQSQDPEFQFCQRNESSKGNAQHGVYMQHDSLVWDFAKKVDSHCCDHM